jgi:hypothetical protein
MIPARNEVRKLLDPLSPSLEPNWEIETTLAIQVPPGRRDLRACSGDHSLGAFGIIRYYSTGSGVLAERAPAEEARGSR